MKKYFSQFLKHVGQRRVIFSLLFIILANIIVYINSFGGQFLFDDILQIVEGDYVHTIAFPFVFLENTRRPFLYLTLAMNYAWGGLNPWGYHLVNVLGHIAASFLLFGCVYRTCRLKNQSTALHADAAMIAFSTALLWSVHPVHTQAVTYIIQRAESLAGMFYLLTFYSAICFFVTRKRAWRLFSLLACLLGGLMKETLITAPVGILLYDRLFISGSFQQAWKKNKILYLGFLIPWAAMLLLYLTAHPETIPSEGFALKDITPVDYLTNQGPVMLRYLFLSIWPFSLTFDYAWKPVHGGMGIWAAGVLVVTLVAWAIRQYYRRSVIGFLLLLFFFILAPSSSIFPLKDLIFEYRLYLPLACLVILAVFGGWQLVKTRPHYFPAMMAIYFGITVIFSVATIQRNFDYHSLVRLWQDTVQKCPQNVRAVSNLGLALNKEKRYNDALSYYEKALALDPQYPNTYQNLGILRAGQGEYAEAEKCFRKVIALEPTNAKAHIVLGFALLDQGRPEDAILPLKKALVLGQQTPVVYRALGTASMRSGKEKEGLTYFEQARRLEMKIGRGRGF